MTTIGELRETLIDCIAQVKAGTMREKDARAIAALAGQVVLSIQVELNVKRERLNSNAGSLSIGRNSDVVEVQETPAPSGPWAGLVKS